MIRAAVTAAAVPGVLVLFLGAGFASLEQAPATGSPLTGAQPTGGTPPAAYPGGSTGCTVLDPTSPGGCITGATAWLLDQIATHIHTGPVRCWDAHPWNPASDHPRGRACDYTMGRLGRLPDTAQTTQGWRLATWLRAHAGALHVAYVIWQGRIWSRGRDDEGWRAYTGAGVYDPSDITGGHYDHVHVSLTD